jgi:muramoyltetrapeptide carboxypeptidase LdcA involved in peptidoglycan recycling
MIIPPKLKKGDEIRVIAPSRNLNILSQNTIDIALRNIQEMGFKVSFGKNVSKTDEFMSSSVEDRVSDLHEAFIDNNVKAILTVIGGYNSNQLLNYIDFALIKNNPKIICGYSDITVLLNSITTKTGIVTYLGPHFSSFGMLKGLDYTKEFFLRALTQEDPYELHPAPQWSDDLWFINQDSREFIDSKGFQSLNHGEVVGKVFGGNISSFCLLNGTEFAPNLENSILLIEGHSEIKPYHFDRLFQSILHQPSSPKIKGIIIGIPQKDCNLDVETISKILQNKHQIKDLPIIMNVNFGHTTPILTLPIGGEMKISINNNCKLFLTKV